MKNTIHELIRRAVAYHPIIAKVTGSVKITVLWSQIQYWSEKTNDPNGWVYKTQSDIFDETGMKRKETETARALGKKLGVLDSEVRGNPPIVNYRVNEEKMFELIEEYIKKHPQKKVRNFEIKKEAKKNEAVDLPEWLDKKAWSDWEQHRKEKKQKLTPLTIKQQLKFLEQHKSDHVEIIQNSIRNGWRGLFELKRPKPSDNQIRQQSKEEADRKAKELERMSKPLSEEERKRAQIKLQEVRKNLTGKFILKR